MGAVLKVIKILPSLKFKTTKVSGKFVLWNLTFFLHQEFCTSLWAWSHQSSAKQRQKIIFL